MKSLAYPLALRAFSLAMVFFMVLVSLTVLGEARTQRSFKGSNKISDIVLERLPNTILLLTTSILITQRCRQ